MRGRNVDLKKYPFTNVGYIFLIFTNTTMPVQYTIFSLKYVPTFYININIEIIIYGYCTKQVLILRIHLSFIRSNHIPEGKL